MLRIGSVHVTVLQFFMPKIFTNVSNSSRRHTETITKEAEVQKINKPFKPFKLKPFTDNWMPFEHECSITVGTVVPYLWNARLKGHGTTVFKGFLFLA